MTTQPPNAQPWDIDKEPPDVAILVALEEEFQTIEDDVSEHWQVRDSRGHHGLDYFFELPPGYKCVATFMGKMGTGHAGRFARHLLNLRPALIVNIGIAGSLKNNDLCIGDVLVPEEVIAYSETAKMKKADSGKLEEMWERRTENFRPSPRILGKIPHLRVGYKAAHAPWSKAGGEDLKRLWQRPVMDGLVEKRLLRTEPMVSTKHLASGNFVVASERFGNWIREGNGNIFGAEMEAAGMMMEVTHEVKPKLEDKSVESLVIRGISDHIGEDKSKLDDIKEGAFRGLAMRNAWRFFRMLMEIELLPRHNRPSTLSLIDALSYGPASSEDWNERSIPRVTTRIRPAATTPHFDNSQMTPFWLRSHDPDELRFGEKICVLEKGQTEFLLGSEAQGNHFIVGSRAVGVSRHSLCIQVRNGRTFIRRLPTCSNDVWIGNFLLHPGEERDIHHGQTLIIGKFKGQFRDGRYAHRPVDTDMIDHQTDLLGRLGLAAQFAYERRELNTLTMLVLRATGHQLPAEKDACTMALAMHGKNARVAIGRVGVYVIALLRADEEKEYHALVNTARLAVTSDVVAGYLAIAYDEPREAVVLLERSFGALEQAAIIDGPKPLHDLAANRPHVEMNLGAFKQKATELLTQGGEVLLVAILERAPIVEIKRQEVLDTLVREVIASLWARAGENAIFTVIDPDVIGCASPKKLELFADEVASGWRTHPPVRLEKLVMDARLTFETISARELNQIESVAQALAIGSVARIEALPQPLALRARAAVSTKSALEVGVAFTDFIVEIWRFLAIFWTSVVLREELKKPFAETAPTPHGPWLDPWWPAVRAAIPGIRRLGGRANQLLEACMDQSDMPVGALSQAMELGRDIQVALDKRPIDNHGLEMAAHMIPNLVDKVVRQLADLRGWVLLAVEDIMFTRPPSEAVRLTYLDCTGSYERGTLQHKDLESGPRVGRHVCMARFGDMSVVPLEPFVRLHWCAQCGARKLFWVDEPILARGRAMYRCLPDGHALQMDVSEGALPDVLRTRPGA